MQTFAGKIILSKGVNDFVVNYYNEEQGKRAEKKNKSNIFFIKSQFNLVFCYFLFLLVMDVQILKANKKPVKRKKCKKSEKSPYKKSFLAEKSTDTSNTFM